MDLKRMQQIISDKDKKGPGPKPKSKNVKGTGLSIYGGGIEKTPTGKSNAFAESGLTEETLLDYANRYKFPTTSNKEFQQAQLDMLSLTEEGKAVINNMIQKYGMTKAGTLADDILGARTFEIMKAIDNIKSKEKPKEAPKAQPIDEYFQDSRMTDYPSYMIPGSMVLSSGGGTEYGRPTSFAGLINTRTGKIAPVRKEDYKKFGINDVAAKYLEARMKSNPEEFDFDTKPDEYGYIYRRKTGKNTGASKIKMDMSTGQTTKTNK